MYTYIHTYIHVYIYIGLHTYIHTYNHTYIDPVAQIHFYPYILYLSYMILFE